MAIRNPYPEGFRVKAAQLRQHGLSYAQIGRKLGVPVSTVSRWLNPEYAQRSRRNSRNYKLQRRNTCSECGKPVWITSSSCVPCSARKKRKWTRQTIRQAIQDWANNHDGKPPTSAQWRTSGDNHPAASTVYSPRLDLFKSWNEAIADAGFTPRHTSPGPHRSSWSKDEARQLRNQGLTDVEIARRLGVSTSAIYQRIGPRGNIPKPKARKTRTREKRIQDLRNALQHQ